MQIVVLAAGRGTRLRPVTENRSKAMAPVLDRPLVERALAPWVANGLTDAIFVVGPEDDEIRAVFRPGNALGVAVRFVVQEERRGMAHALGLAAPSLRGDFCLTACDSLVPTDHTADLLAAHRDGTAVLSLMDVPEAMVARSASVELDGMRIRRIVEKPNRGEAPSNTVSLPHYVLPQRLLDILPDLEPSERGEIELQDGIQRLIDEDRPVVGVRTLSRLQVSNPDDLLHVNLEELAKGEEAAVVHSATVSGDAELIGRLRIDREVVVGRRCVIGPNVFLERGCALGDDVTVRNSVVLRGARVADGSAVDGMLLV